jgi:hypothetical protein
MSAYRDSGPHWSLSDTRDEWDVLEVTVELAHYFMTLRH